MGQLLLFLILCFKGIEHCGAECSVNCLKSSEDKLCNGINGPCLGGCKDGFYGDKCDRKCRTNCLTNKCDKDTGNCRDGCRDRYTGLMCEKAQELNVRGEITNVVIIGAFVGAFPCLLIICAVIVLLERLKREAKEIIGDTACTGRVNDTVSGRNRENRNSEKDTYEKLIAHETAEVSDYLVITLDDNNTNDVEP